MSEVDKAEIVMGTSWLMLFCITVGVAYYLAKQRDKEKNLRVILNWFSVLYTAGYVMMILIVLISDVFHFSLSPDVFYYDYFPGLVVAQCYGLLVFIPFFIVLWIYDFALYIKRK